MGQEEQSKKPICNPAKPQAAANGSGKESGRGSIFFHTFWAAGWEMAGKQGQSEIMLRSRKPIQAAPQNHLQFLGGPEVNKSFPLASLGLRFKKYTYL